MGTHQVNQGDNFLWFLILLYLIFFLYNLNYIVWFVRNWVSTSNDRFLSKLKLNKNNPINRIKEGVRFECSIGSTQS